MTTQIYFSKEIVKQDLTPDFLTFNRHTPRCFSISHSAFVHSSIFQLGTWDGQSMCASVYTDLDVIR